jgi:glutamate/tyrosine decarboxylase-like PLP-dependent enzyme
MSLKDNRLYPAPIEAYEHRLSTLSSVLTSQELPAKGLSDTEEHLQEIASAIPRAAEPTYFGFVTGGVTTAAYHADNLVTELDANVGVHLPDTSIATVVEDTALKWLLQLYNLNPEAWGHRTLTTGATASNVLGLACGRDFVVREAGKRLGVEEVSVAEQGLAKAFKKLRVAGIRVLTSMPHSSMGKAASIVGIGRDSVVNLIDSTRPPYLDLQRLEQELNDTKYLYIVAVSCGEVNTGRFATDGIAMNRIRTLCDERGAWLHIDGGASPSSFKNRNDIHFPSNSLSLPVFYPLGEF